MSHDTAIALTGLWAGVAVAALPFAATWQLSDAWDDTSGRTVIEPGYVFGALLWPIIVFAIPTLLVTIPAMMGLDWVSRHGLDWWTDDWSARPKAGTAKPSGQVPGNHKKRPFQNG